VSLAAINLCVASSGVFVVVIPVLFLTEHHAMKVYWESGDTAPLIL
jgi:hypothetical protein